MTDIRRGDRVVRTDFHESDNGWDITTHPGMVGEVTHVRSSDGSGPDYAELTFILNQYTYNRTVRVDKLRKVG